VRLWVFACEHSTRIRLPAIYTPPATSRVYAICASGDLIFDYLHRACYKFVARCGGIETGVGAWMGCAIRHLNHGIETN
jgi:hypothetical protein